MTQTLIICKPDAVARGLVGSILGRFEARGFAIRALELRTLERSIVEQHYVEHRERPFFGELVEFLVGGPVVLAVLEGSDDTVAIVRTMMGSTNPAEAIPGTVRGDMAMLIGENLIHGSDSVESAAREIGLFFPNLSVTG
ncbi:MAG: nucleoside-diphosphate kinase [Ferrimicrobium sp.]